MKKLLLTQIFIFIGFFSFSQITFQKQININGFDAGVSVKQTSDEGFIITGYTNNNLLLIKTNAYGDVLWNRTITNIYGSGGNDVCILSNLDYGIAGWISDTSGDVDLLFMRISSNGDSLWAKSYGGNKFDVGYSVCSTQVGGLVATGQTRSFGDTLGDLYLIKVDENGILQWQKTYGSDQWDYGCSIKNTVDSGFIIAGQKTGKQYVLKTNSIGDTSWTESFSLYNSTDILPINNGYINISYNLTKLNQSGDIIWEKPDYGGRSIALSYDSGYVFVSSFFDGMNYEHVVIFKVNSIGDSIWKKIFSGDHFGDNIRGVDIEKTSDNGYVVTGIVQPASGWQYVLLIKTDENGYVGIDDNKNVNSIHASVFPNPFSDYTNIKISGNISENSSLCLYNVLGTKVMNIEPVNSNNIIIQRNDLPAGIYFYELFIYDIKVLTGKIIIN